MENNCIILDIEQTLQNDLKIALLCMGLKVLIQGWSRLVEVNLSIPSKHFLN